MMRFRLTVIPFRLRRSLSLAVHNVFSCACMQGRINAAILEVSETKSVIVCTLKNCITLDLISNLRQCELRLNAPR
jgi:hypothetical protein